MSLKIGNSYVGRTRTVYTSGINSITCNLRVLIEDGVTTISDADLNYGSTVYTGVFDGNISYANNSLKSISTNIFGYISNFGGATNLEYARFGKCTSIGWGAFRLLKKLEYVEFPDCTFISNVAFGYCDSLQTISFPKCITIGNDAFDRCGSLQQAVLPCCESIGGYAFESCWKMRSVYAPRCTYIGSSAFRFCSELHYLYLLGSSVPRLAHYNALSYTPFCYYYGEPTTKIYVRPSMVSKFKTSTNWIEFSSMI